jgi:hypothetical protein
LVRDNHLESDIGTQKNGLFYKNRNSTGSLYCTGNRVVNPNIEEITQQLKSDAKKAIWVLVVLNVSVLILFILQSHGLAYAILFIQLAIFIFWLLPVALYQIVRKNSSIKLAAYKALASYRNIMGQVSW